MIGTDTTERPTLFGLLWVDGLSIRDIEVRHPAFWTIHPTFSNNVVITGNDIYTNGTVCVPQPLPTYLPTYLHTHPGLRRTTIHENRREQNGCSCKLMLHKARSILIYRTTPCSFITGVVVVGVVVGGGGVVVNVVVAVVVFVSLLSSLLLLLLCYCCYFCCCCYYYHYCVGGGSAVGVGGLWWWWWRCLLFFI